MSYIYKCFTWAKKSPTLQNPTQAMVLFAIDFPVKLVFTYGDAFSSRRQLSHYSRAFYDFAYHI